MANTYPQLVAFDLDYTLWQLYIDTHVEGPLRRRKDTLNEVLDRYDTPIKLDPEVPSILHRLRAAGTTIAACSRTSEPKLAKQALSLLLVPPSKMDADGTPEPAIDFFNQLEIYPGSKIAHFKALHTKTGIPYSDMLFFDDERRNKEVERLGVTFILVHSKMDESLLESGLSEWRRRHPVPEVEDSQGTGTSEECPS